MKKYLNFSRLLAIFLLSSLIVACGFKLKGHEEFSYSTIYIDGGSNIFNQLRSLIATNGSPKIVSSPNQADIILTQLDDNDKDQIISLKRTGSVAQYSLQRWVRYRITNRQGKEIQPMTTISRFDELIYNENAPLAKDDEKNLLYSEMEKQMAEQLLRRLAKVHP